jgi:hypothetical protein
MTDRRVTAVVNLLVALAPVTIAYAEEAETEDDASPSAATQLLEQLRPSGSWRTDYFQSSKALDDDTGFLGGTLQIKALPGFTDRIDGKLEARVTNSAIGAGGATRFRLLEGYVAMHFAKADLRVGKQIVAWGRADGINPTDNLTPRDFTVMLPFEDDQRVGTPGVRLDTFVSQEHTLTFFATPFFEPAEVPLPAGAGALTERTPARSLSEMQMGLKLDKVGEGYDFSVSLFRGNSLLPQLNLIAVGADGPQQELRYDRITVLGADFARNYGRFGFRGELAYVDTADDSGADPRVKNPYLFWIAGVDRTFFENLNLNLQFYQRRVRKFQAPDAFVDPLDRDTVTLNAIFNGQRDPVSNGISFRISNQWLNETLEAEVFAAINLDHSNSFVRPLVTYAFNDYWKGTIGAEIYQGPEDTPFGSQKSNRGAFVELRYSF